MATTAKKKKETIVTGVSEVDDKLGGGIPLGSLCLIEGHSDAGKSVLCQHLTSGTLAGGNISLTVNGGIGAITFGSGAGSPQDARAGDGGIDEAWAHGRDTDAVRRELFAQRFGESKHPKLGRAIG